MISVTLQDLIGQIRVAKGTNVRPIIILVNFLVYAARVWKATDANMMLMNVNDMEVRANMVASVKMNLEHFIATAPLDMVALIVKKILTNVLISLVWMEEHVLMQSMISSVLAEKVSNPLRLEAGSDIPTENTGISLTLLELSV